MKDAGCQLPTLILSRSSFKRFVFSPYFRHLGKNTRAVLLRTEWLQRFTSSSSSSLYSLYFADTRQIPDKCHPALRLPVAGSFYLFIWLFGTPQLSAHFSGLVEFCWWFGTCRRASEAVTVWLVNVMNATCRLSGCDYCCDSLLVCGGWKRTLFRLRWGNREIKWRCYKRFGLLNPVVLVAYEFKLEFKFLKAAFSQPTTRGRLLWLSMKKVK